MGEPRRILQLHNLHGALGGGAVDVLDHERDLLAAAGYTVDRFVVTADEARGMSPVRAGAKAVWNRQSYAQVGRAIETLRPDLVHLHTPFPLMSPSVLYAAARANVPVVGTNHSHRYVCPGGNLFLDGEVCTRCVGLTWKWPAVSHSCYHDSAAGSAALSLSLGLHKTGGSFRRKIARMIALSDLSRDLLVRDGFDPAQVIVKPNSVPAPDAGLRAEEVRQGRFVFAGRLVPEKGVGTLLEAWSLLERPEAELVVMGDGPMRDMVESRAGTDRRIRVEGWKSQAAVMAAMATSEATIIPSECYEGGFPLVGMQSLSVGTPVITSDVPNLEHPAVDDGCGTSYRGRDAAALAAVLEGFSAGSGTREAAVAAYQSRYSDEINSSALRAIYEEVLSGAASTSRGS